MEERKREEWRGGVDGEVARKKDRGREGIERQRV